MRTMVLLACCGVIAGCGDSSGGALSSSTTSSTAGTTTTSSSLANTGEIKPTSDASYFSSTMELDTSTGTTNQTNGGTSGGTTTGRVVTLGTPNFAASYSSQAGYRLSDLANSATFGPAQFVNETSSPSTAYPSVNFSSIAQPNEDYLAVYKEAFSTPTSTGSINYPSMIGGVAGWQHTVVGSSSRHTRVDYFGYGPITPNASMPKSGVVKFFAVGSGNYATDNSLFFTSTGDNVTIDFGAGTVKGSITASGQNFYADQHGVATAASYTGTISGNTVDAPLLGTDATTVVGRMHLYFVGPAANEFIIVYSAQNSIFAQVGASVGIRNPN